MPIRRSASVVTWGVADASQATAQEGPRLDPPELLFVHPHPLFPNPLALSAGRGGRTAAIPPVAASRYAWLKASASSGLLPIFSLVTSLGSTTFLPAGSIFHFGASSCDFSRCRVGRSRRPR